MTPDLLVVLVLLVLAVGLFVSERLPLDVVALLILVALLVTGILTPQEGLAGFAHPATVTVAALFVLSAGLLNTGVLDGLDRVIVGWGAKRPSLAISGTMVVVGSISAFVNNTAAVALFMPVILSASRSMRLSPSKLLMPLSFAAMLGGVCTLIGTSTNIIVASIAQEHGQAAFGMFEFSRLGIVFFAAGLAYMIVVGVGLIPARRQAGELAESFRLDAYLTEFILPEGSSSVGKPIYQAPLARDHDLDILQIRRGHRKIVPLPDTVLKSGDVLLVRCGLDEIARLEATEELRLKSTRHWSDAELESEALMLVEAVIAPNSPLERQTLKSMDFRTRFGGTVLALRHRGTLIRERLGHTPLTAGDALLVEIRREHLSRFARNPAFVVVSRVTTPRPRLRRAVPAVVIVAGVVGTAALGLTPIVVSAVAGATLMVLIGCLTPEEAYRAIEWRVIVLLAGVLGLGFALERTGGAALLSTALVDSLGALGPVAVVSGFYLATTLLTETMSNNAAAVLLAPVAIATASAMGIDARPLLMAVTFAASASFMTPVGYQTNTLIYGPGQYRFSDFFRVGAPLNLLLWILATLLIPVLWPLQPQAG